MALMSPRGHDVFLSFRGGDIRDNFLEFLYRALRQKGILTFKDDDKLKDGVTIKDGLLEAIEESRFSIVVLSKNFADSSWCLNELVHILECKRTTGQFVYPVFYHVKPWEVRKQGGAFGEGFARALLKKEEKASSEKEEVKAEMKRWTEVLEEVGNLKGWVYPDAKFSLTVYRDATTLVFTGCPKLVGNEEINVLLGYKFLSDHIIKENNYRWYYGPGSKIPEWFRYQNVGASLSFRLPILDSSTFNLLGFAISVAVVAKDKYCRIGARIRTRGKILRLGNWFSSSNVEHVIILYYPIKFLTTDQLIQMSGTVSEVYFDVHCETAPAMLIECGVHPFYKDEVGSSGKINKGNTKKRKKY